MNPFVIILEDEFIHSGVAQLNERLGLNVCLVFHHASIDMNVLSGDNVAHLKNTFVA